MTYNILKTNDLLPPPAQRVSETKPLRSSNLELYRIVSMLMIVAHHYVVNSGLFDSGGPMVSNPISANTLFLALFGAWGKVGINCFLMITGYFMCTSHITVRKFIKLILQIYLYKLLLFPILLIGGYETLSLNRIVKLIMPVWGFSTSNFTSCFIAFWLTIPFLNILLRNMNKRQHALLVLLLLCFFTLFGTIPHFEVPLNYITWFGIIYLISAYLRLYPNPLFERKKLWGWLTLFTTLVALASVTGMQYLYGSKGINYSYFFVRDSNKILAVAYAVCSFLWFKNMNIRHSKIINAFGAGTFGVLLIHANSNAMRTWLWKDTVDCVGHYSLQLGALMLYSIGVVLAVFIICNLMDQLRIATVEKCFFNWYDRQFAAKVNTCVNRFVNKRQNTVE